MSHQSPATTEARTTEWEILIACCAPQVSLEKLAASLRQPPDWHSLTALAEEHGVLAHAASAFGALDPALIPPLARALFQERLRVQIIRSLRITAELFRLVDLLAKDGLEIPIVKGPVLSVRAYGDAGGRPYGDLDFLARHEEIARVTELMQRAGYDPAVSLAAIKAGRIPGQYLFRGRESHSLVEFHTEKTLRYFPRPLPAGEFYRRRTNVLIDGHAVSALAAEDEFVLICIHGAKHFWERLIWIADVAAFMAQQEKLNWSRVSDSAAAVGATRMVHAGAYLASKLLCASIPHCMENAVAQDGGLRKIAKKVEKWLPAAGEAFPGIAGRAAFRVAMYGGGLGGVRYVMRLAFSPTEEDWRTGEESRAARISDALRRPLRLVRKYGRGGN